MPTAVLCPDLLSITVLCDGFSTRERSVKQLAPVESPDHILQRRTDESGVQGATRNTQRLDLYEANS